MRKLVWFALMAMSMWGCATVLPSVMYSPQGNFLVVAHDTDRSTSIWKGYRSAEQHCTAQQKRMQLLSEVTVYQGPFTEELHEAAKAAEEATRVYGSLEGQYRLGSLVSSSSSDYKTTIEFRCQ